MNKYNQRNILWIMDKWKKVGFIADDIVWDAQDEWEDKNTEAYEDMMNLSYQMKELDKTLNQMIEKYVES